MKQPVARSRALAWIIVLVCIAPAAYAQSTGTCAQGNAEADLDINNVQARLYNTGGLFWKDVGRVYRVPKTGTAHSIFASGIWIGGHINGILHVAGSDYGPWEFWPGPLDASGNPPVDCTLYDRIYKVSKQDLINYKIKGIVSADLADWPVDLGAPVVDGDGIAGNYNLADGDLPKLIGDQTLWWVMNDVGNEHAWSHSPPIGLEIQVTAFAFDRPDAFGNSTFYKYKRSCWRSQATWAIRAWNGDIRVNSGCSPESQLTARTTLIAEAVATCCKCVRDKPKYRADRMPIRRTPL